MVVKKSVRFGLFLALALLVLAPFFVSAEVEGCYLYPGGSEDLYCQLTVLESQAQADCAQHEDCDMNVFFEPNVDCNIVDYPECRLVTCDVDCAVHPEGKCATLGVDGKALNEEQRISSCTPGCCIVPGTQVCQILPSLYGCHERARSALGFSYDPLSSVIFQAGLSTNDCRNQCGTELEPATLTISVSDLENNPIEDFQLEIDGEPQDTPSGISLSPGVHPLTITAIGYNPLSASISLSSGEVKEVTYNLVPSGEFTISGTVSGRQADGTIILLASATISWEGAARDFVTTSSNGNYQTPGLNSGNYNLKASAIGYLPQEKAIEVAGDTSGINFILEKSVQVGIHGTTYLQDGEVDTPQHSVRIQVNGVPRSQSNYLPLETPGTYEVSLTAGREYNITFSFPGYESQTIPVTPPRAEPLDVFLIKYIGECDFEYKPVEILTATNVPGEKAIRLEWDKPCHEVIGYKILRNGQFLDIINAQTLTDYDVEWEGDYTYEIFSLFEEAGIAGPTPASPSPINVGYEVCEGKFLTGRWDTFCLDVDPYTGRAVDAADVSVRKTIWTCNNLNQPISLNSCTENDLAGFNYDYYCARINEHEADCKDGGACTLLSNPFGLYYERDACYGEENENFCYFDYSNKTIVNECRKCTEVQSCFAYLSEDACNQNNCVSEGCKWIDSAANNETPILDYSTIFSQAQPFIPTSTTDETGVGFCTNPAHDDDDNCYRCGKEGSIFENFFCTAQICSGLGKCFSQVGLASCQSCGEDKEPTREANCYTYASALECVGQPQQEIYADPENGQLVFSQDRCGWERCSWRGDEDSVGESCFKDGDGDGQDDCTAQEFPFPGEMNSCRLDMSPPRTKILAEGMPIISTLHPDLEFLGDDEFNTPGTQASKMRSLGYCLTSAEVDSCTLDQMKRAEVNYPGIFRKEQLNLTLVKALGENINGEAYKLKYYSTDEYHNREQLQETFIYIDNVAPEFEIGNLTVTENDVTDLTVFLIGIEPLAKCNFGLSQILPIGGKTDIPLGREISEKTVLFENLNGVRYDLNVTCEDKSGNARSRLKTFIFDQEQRIDIIAPDGVYAQTELVFKIRTVSPANCGLFNSFTNEEVERFNPIDNESKEHETLPISGFYEKNFAGEFKAVCTEIFSPVSYEDYFDFVIDFTYSDVQIKLTEGEREVVPLGYGWEEYFVESVGVNFECISSTGFTCEEIYYCLGEECELISNGEYELYEATATLTNSTEICYYAIDAGGNSPYAPTCGKVLVEGYGITLEKPDKYYYQGEQWGISNQPVFDLQLSTKIPTEECRFDFIPDFDYNNVPLVKTRDKNEQGKYLFQNFPESVFSEYSENGGVKAIYVKCNSSSGEIGPETKIYLEYDPSAPEILDSYAEPDLVLEGVTTELYVETDDKTLCKYSDDSDFGGSGEYTTMEYSFPGLDENILNINHQDAFHINFISEDGRKDYYLNVQCANGAGDLSELEIIEFSVDYSSLGFLSYVWPRDEYLTGRDLTLQADTSKNGFCQYSMNGTYINFAEGEGGREHRQSLGNLAENEYLIPFSCILGDHLVEDVFSFTIDLTPPTITNVEDNNFTCGSPEMAVMVTSEIDSIGGYYYEVYDLGEDRNINPLPINTTARGSRSNLSSPTVGSSLSSTGVLVLNATVGAELPINIPTGDLLDSHKYQVKVQAFDLAGNLGQFKLSNGFWVVPSNYSTCQESDPPRIETNIIPNCTATWVDFRVSDTNGLRQMKFGENYERDACQANRTYNGQPLSFNRKTWLCYFAEDVINNSQASKILVPFDDEDGDGISDIEDCDICPDTPSGRVVDNQGCAPGQIGNQTLDTDHDGLPDEWEKDYYSQICLLDFNLTDSDGNGIGDGAEDYDGDGYNNFEEYQEEQNPCIKERVTNPDGTEPGPGTTPGEEPDGGEPGILDTVKESNTFAVILLIFGLLLLFGGLGYLIYDYNNQGKKPPRERESFIPVEEIKEKTDSAVDTFKNKLFGIRKKTEEKNKQRRRESAFAAFSSSSPIIPHVDNIINKKVPHISKVQELAKKYVEHKEEIKPGLRPEEKSVFNRLEQITQKTKDKGIKEVVSPEEAKDIFAKLKELSKKRKGSS